MFGFSHAQISFQLFFLLLFLFHFLCHFQFLVKLVVFRINNIIAFIQFFSQVQFQKCSKRLSDIVSTFLILL